MDVTDRSVQRDLELLEKAGMVERQKRGGYRLADTAAWEGPRLTQREAAVLLALAERASDEAAGPGEPSERSVARSGIGRALVSLPRVAREQLEQVQAILGDAPTAERRWLAEQPWFPVLLEGLVRHAGVQLWLADEPAEDSAPPQVVIPTQLVFRDGRWWASMLPLAGSSSANPEELDLSLVIRGARD